MIGVNYDYIVLGGGSGGLASARRAAQYGAKVLLIEAGALGGTCVNVGCVPKKMMWNAAFVADTLRDAPGYGFASPPLDFAWAEFKRRRDESIERLHGIYRRNLERDGVELKEGWGRLTGPHSVTVTGADGQESQFSSPNILLATGGRPTVPEVVGAELGATSDDFFAWEQRPARVAVVGAGYVAVEFAGVLAALGSLVTLVVRGERALRCFESAVAQVLDEEMIAQGIRVVRNFEAVSLERRSGGLSLSSESSELEGVFDEVIWAVGRSPLSREIGLEEAGVELDGDGFIRVDELQRSSVPGVFAVGDVTGILPLTPVAISAGRKLADRLFGGHSDAKLDGEQVPTVIFSHPPIGTVGLTEKDARSQYGDGEVRCYETRFTDLYTSLSHRRAPTLMKLVCVGDSERVVGLHLIGRAADEIIQGFAVAIRMGATKADLDRTIAIHPTSAEELVTMR